MFHVNEFKSDANIYFFIIASIFFLKNFISLLLDIIFNG